MIGQFQTKLSIGKASHNFWGHVYVYEYVV